MPAVAPVESDSSCLRSFAIGCAAAALTLASNTVLADQGGVPFWTSGQFASLAATPPTPGWSLAITPYYYSGSAEVSKTFQRGDSLVAGTQSTSPLLTFQPGYATQAKILGGQAFVGLAWGPGNNRASVDLALSQPALSVSRADSITGGSDLYPFASLAWVNGNDNFMTYLTGDIPVGAYQASRLANVGIGHGAIDAGGAYTFLNDKSGLEFSATVGVTYNWENGHANYRNGVDSHLDWAVSQFYSEKWELGIVGYLYYQLTGDSGSGDKVGAFKSRVAAVGPEVGYTFKFNGQPASINLRGYREFWAQNRVEGYALFGTLSLPLANSGK